MCITTFNGDTIEMKSPTCSESGISTNIKNQLTCQKEIKIGLSIGAFLTQLKITKQKKIHMFILDEDSHILVKEKGQSFYAMAMDI